MSKSKIRFSKPSPRPNKIRNVLPRVGDGILETVHENLTAKRMVSKMNNRDKCPNAAENMERLLTLKRDLCVVPGCPRKSVYWTPKGKFCGKHREEAMAAMRVAKKERYGDN